MDGYHSFRNWHFILKTEIDILWPPHTSVAYIHSQPKAIFYIEMSAVFTDLPLIGQGIILVAVQSSLCVNLLRKVGWLIGWGLVG